MNNPKNLIDSHEDLQALLTGGYKRLPHAKYVLLHFADPKGGLRFVKGLVPQVTSVGTIKQLSDVGAWDTKWQQVRAVNVAFSHTGLQKLGLAPETLNGFSRAFKEGMNDPLRTRMLGDFGPNAPEHWQFGQPEARSVDMLLMLFTPTQEAADTRLAELQQVWEAQEVELVVPPIDSCMLDGLKEHFGFRDGIAQPIVTGLGKENPATPPIATGEVLLGHKDQYAEYPRNPGVPAGTGDPSVLPMHEPEERKPDQADAGAFGTNGTYLVFRKLYQHVTKFWQFLAEETTTNGQRDEEAMVSLASKMMGRWPSGVPLIKEPERDTEDPKLMDFDDFLYAHPKFGDDAHGYKTPRGSHIRRTNPRDALHNAPEESLQITEKHRMLRRGRPYGAPLAPSLKPADMLQTADDGQDRGLLFLALCSDINRHFEFNQKSWVDSPQFDDLYYESDPVIGNHYQKDGVVTDTFTIQQCPFRRRVKNIPQFVEMKGGAYFFMPSMRALEYINTL